MEVLDHITVSLDLGKPIPGGDIHRLRAMALLGIFRNLSLIQKPGMTLLVNLMTKTRMRRSMSSR